ncbi:MAG: hypothetical protein ABI134_32680 [Byssovorax sp.]
MAVAASCGLAASCSLVTTWDGLTSSDAGPGSGGSGGNDVADGSASDAAPDATPAFECTPEGHYCGGDRIKGSTTTLYICNADGSGTVLEHCVNGCVVTTGKDDACG